METLRLPPKTEDAHQKFNGAADSAYRYLEMRDVIADETTCLQRFEKASPGPLGQDFSVRAIACTWQ